MNMPLMKAEPATVTPATTAKVVPLPPKRPALATRTRMVLGKVAERVVPPVVVIAVALLIWELLCRRAGSTLPPPSRVICTLPSSVPTQISPFCLGDSLME